MNFKYIECINPNPLIQNFYELNVGDSSIPLISKVIPSALCHIIFLDTKSPVEIHFKNNVFKNNGLVVLGQSYKSYTVKASTPYYNFGINLHPTGLYKLLKTDISKLTDKHIKLSEVSTEIYNLLNSIFIKELNPEKIAKKIEIEILNLSFLETKNTKLVDDAIQLIYSKKGIISVDELLKLINISQKHLETQFKKIIGLTPLKFIKLYKFLNLMKQYASKEASISELIGNYNYYDQSHFTKDFQLFMNQTPSDYFKSDHEFLNNYLKS